MGHARTHLCNDGDARRADPGRIVSRLRLAPAALVWILFGIVAVEIVATYWRIPPAQLYHVSGTGAAGGFGRALVFLNFPLALAALPLVVLAADRLRHRPAAVAVAAISVALCAVIFWPGVVDQADLDARPINALPAAGVLLALALTAATGLYRLRTRIHPAPAAFGLALLLLALPWIAADLGFFLDGVPVLGRLFLTKTIYQGHPAVHHGHHHGMDGTLLALGRARHRPARAPGDAAPASDPGRDLPRPPTRLRSR